MDGTKHKAKIESWFDSVVQSGGIERYDDLHIDQIDSGWKPRDKWISAAIECFEMALRIRDSYQGGGRLTVVLAFALVSDTRLLGITFRDTAELQKTLCSTPPSLYVFRPGGEFWTQAEESKGEKVDHDLVIQELSASELFGNMPDTVKCIFMEYRRIADEEYSRDLFLAG